MSDVNLTEGNPGSVRLLSAPCRDKHVEAHPTSPVSAPSSPSTTSSLYATPTEDKFTTPPWSNSPSTRGLMVNNSSIDTNTAKEKTAFHFTKMLFELGQLDPCDNHVARDYKINGVDNQDLENQCITEERHRDDIPLSTADKIQKTIKSMEQVSDNQVDDQEDCTQTLKEIT